MNAKQKHLKQELESLLQGFDFASHLKNDPVELVHQYSQKRDQELVGLIAACLAYGRVSLVKDAGKRAVKPLGQDPVETLLNLSLKDLQEAYEPFVYRMTRGEDLVDLLWGLRALYLRWETMDEAYGAMPGDNHHEKTSALVQWLRSKRARSGQPVTRGLKYLLSDPADGSSSKRLHLFLRWMVRGPDKIDLGLWENVKASELVMPMDTHTARICRYIGLSKRKSVDGKMAAEVTESLKKLDAKDPLRFDFAVCHLGISKGCIHKKSEEHCPGCPLRSICELS